MAVLRQESEPCRLKKGDRVALVACSDARPGSEQGKVESLCGIFRDLGLKPQCGTLLFGEGGRTAPAKERARELMEAYRDPSVRAIFDISGGNLANGVLPWLDFETIAKSGKLFWGYSDLTALMNAVLPGQEGPPSSGRRKTFCGTIREKAGRGSALPGRSWGQGAIFSRLNAGCCGDLGWKALRREGTSAVC